MVFSLFCAMHFLMYICLVLIQPLPTSLIACFIKSKNGCLCFYVFYLISCSGYFTTKKFFLYFSCLNYYNYSYLFCTVCCTIISKLFDENFGFYVKQRTTRKVCFAVVSSFITCNDEIVILAGKLGRRLQVYALLRIA